VESLVSRNKKAQAIRVSTLRLGKRNLPEWPLAERATAAAASAVRAAAGGGEVSGTGTAAPVSCARRSRKMQVD
jgi:hypothetical protein